MGLSQVNNYLAVSMHQLLSEENGNVFFSPFSISTAMAMLLCAAEDETERELRTALGYDSASIEKDDIACIFKDQMLALAKNPDSYTLACANSMLSQKGFTIKDLYKNILVDSFKALLLEVDFQTEGMEAVKQINDWVKEKTKNMIPKLVDTLDPSTVMILMNAVYFKGSWSQKFNESLTTVQNFCNKGLEDNLKEVNMMYRKEKYPYADNESFQALQLPYVDEEVAMLILLPHSKDGLKTVESALTPSFVRDLKQSMRKRKVEVSLPRFRLEYSKSLVSSFQRLGVDKAFKSGAELGAASDASNLVVSDILHKAVLEVNEEGSEAAAATKIAIVKRCMVYDPVFCANHPFAFIIYDTRSDLILFMGRVEEL